MLLSNFVDINTTEFKVVPATVRSGVGLKANATREEIIKYCWDNYKTQKWNWRDVVNAIESENMLYLKIVGDTEPSKDEKHYVESILINYKFLYDV